MQRKKRAEPESTNKDQDAHDKMMSEMSDEQMTKLAKGLGDLMRSKEKSAESSSNPAQSVDSGAAEVGSFTEKDVELAQALGLM